MGGEGNTWNIGGAGLMEVAQSRRGWATSVRTGGCGEDQLNGRRDEGGRGAYRIGEGCEDDTGDEEL